GLGVLRTQRSGRCAVRPRLSQRPPSPGRRAHSRVRLGRARCGTDAPAPALRPPRAPPAAPAATPERHVGFGGGRRARRDPPCSRGLAERSLAYLPCVGAPP